jgi:hypothetical protein
LDDKERERLGQSKELEFGELGPRHKNSGLKPPLACLPPRQPSVFPGYLSKEPIGS